MKPAAKIAVTVIENGKQVMCFWLWYFQWLLIKFKLLNLIYKVFHELVYAYLHELMSWHVLINIALKDTLTFSVSLNFIIHICITLFLVHRYLQWVFFSFFLFKWSSFCFLCLTDDFLSGRSVQFSCLFMSDSLRPHELQHTRHPCPSPTPRVYPISSPLSRWCHPIISSSVIPFSSCPQSFPASGSFQMSQLFS